MLLLGIRAKLQTGTCGRGRRSHTHLCRRFPRAGISGSKTRPSSGTASKCVPGIYSAGSLWAWHDSLYCSPCYVKRERTMLAAAVGGRTSSMDHPRNISNGLSKPCPEPRPRNPYMRSNGGSLNARLPTAERPACTASMTDAPGAAPVSTSSRRSKSVAGNVTRGKLLMHSACNVSCQ